jgi:hypothetical protein
MPMSQIIAGQVSLELGWDRQLKRVRIIAEDSRDERPSFVGMQHVGMDLTREQINRLIRQLRAARDDIYEPDE